MGIRQYLVGLDVSGIVCGSRGHKQDALCCHTHVMGSSPVYACCRLLQTQHDLPE